MDLPPIAALCWLIPAMCLLGAILNSEKSRPYRKPLYGLMALFVFCSGLSLWATHESMKDEALAFAVERGNMAEVEECLRQGANPKYVPVDTGPNLIEKARDAGHEKIAQRLERAVKERG